MVSGCARRADQPLCFYEFANRHSGFWADSCPSLARRWCDISDLLLPARGLLAFVQQPLFSDRLWHQGRGFYRMGEASGSIGIRRIGRGCFTHSRRPAFRYALYWSQRRHFWNHCVLFAEVSTRQAGIPFSLHLAFRLRSLGSASCVGCVCTLDHDPTFGVPSTDVRLRPCVGIGTSGWRGGRISVLARLAQSRTSAGRLVNSTSTR